MYRGQLDDSRLGNERPVTGHDLRAALDAVLSMTKPSMPVSGQSRLQYQVEERQRACLFQSIIRRQQSDCDILHGQATALASAPWQLARFVVRLAVELVDFFLKLVP